MKVSKIMLKCMILILFVAGFIQAQGSGRIRGKVLDKETGEVLPGANVLLEGTSIGAAASFEGEYYIRSIPPGNYTMVVKYLGYKDERIPVTVVAGKTIEVDVELEYVALETGEVVITAQAEGQMEAINQQLSANTIKNIVSSDRIKDIPDVNAAESVARLPGISLIRSGGEGQKVTIRGLSPQYNVMMVNGVRLQSTDRENRSVDLNMIAPNILSGIEVTKVLTADMDADAVGGTVNLRISKAREGLHTNFSAQGGYASLANDNPYGNYRLAALVSNRVFDNKLGIQLSVYIDNYNRNSDRLSASYTTNVESITNEGLIPTLLNDVNIYDDVRDRKRYGGSLVFDYQFSNGTLLLNNFIGSLKEHQIQQRNYFTTSYDWRGYATDREFTNTVISNALQGEFEFYNVNMDFSISNSITTQRHPGDLTLDMRTRSGGVQGWVPDSVIAGKENQVSPSVLLNHLQVLGQDKIVNNVNTLKRDIDETAQSAIFNVKIPYNFFSYISGDLKLGGKYERNTRKNDETAWYIDVDRGGLALDFNTLLRDVAWTDLGITKEDNGLKASLFADPDYDIGDFLSGEEGIGSNVFYNKVSIWKMHRLADIAKEYGYYLPDPLGSTQYDYNYTRNFYAFYLMTEMKIGKFITLTPGLRYEKFGFDYTADSTYVFGRLTTPGEYYYDYKEVHWDSTKDDNWFPQILLRIKPANWLDIRLASTKSIIYPDYRAVSPYLFIDTYGDPVLRMGNPYLKTAITQNYDVYVSVYDNYIGLFTAGLFYKEIENLIVPITYFTKDASKINYRYPLTPNQRTTVYTWTNLEEKSYVRGIELDWQTHFWFLPSFLKGLVLNINYTHINSETRYPYFKSVAIGSGIFKKYTYIDTTRSGRLINQPNDILNLTIGYDIGDFSARLSFQYTDNVLRSAHTVYQELDSYTAPYSRWDFTAYQKLPWLKGLQVYLNINNITNRPDRQFVSVLEKLSGVEYYGTTADLGVRYSF
ncbi:TonB-dependent receptor [Melioribacter roseus P3M-2]|uniref:TonB-dependent receptor n=1 Tax=Melioribacter roseus (strain DSM 23840 / JCM 17771 / VKM B-2668 / P3M-2) TaxID=1191523 RepID=I6ZW83_MELRP|nr:TonB-dependent receptor [Melioribacter roseus]AFN73333.1 TonB-dependent receptor [Melioribacter roseus P3M-2]